MSLFRKVVEFYADGFRNMTIGKTLWAIVIVKLFIIFAIFRLFFFHDFLDSRFHSDQEKGDYVIEQLTTKPK